MKKCYVLILGLVLPLMGMAQWSGRGEVRTFHCKGCVGVPDLELSPSAMAMQGVVKADIELCDSLGRTVDAWRQVPLGAEGDTAVAAAVYRFMLRRVGYAELATDRMRGHLFENMVIADIVKRFCNEGRTPELMFYRDSNGNEVDLLVAKGQAIEAYEIKSSATYNSSFESVFGKLTPALDARLTHRAVVYGGRQERRDAPIEVLRYTSLLSV